MIFSSIRTLCLVALASSSLIPLIAQDEGKNDPITKTETNNTSSSGTTKTAYLPEEFVRTFRNPFMRNVADEEVTKKSTKKRATPFWGNLKNIFKSEPNTPEKPNTTEEVVDNHGTDGTVIPPKSSSPSIADTDAKAEDAAGKSEKPFWGNLKNIFKSESGTPEKPKSTEEVVDNQGTDGTVIPPKSSPPSIAKTDTKAEDPEDKSAKPFWGNLKNIFKSEPGTPEKPSSTEEVVGNQGTDGTVIPPKTASKSSLPSIADTDAKTEDSADKSAKPFWGNLKNIFKSEPGTPEKPNSTEEVVDNQGTDGTVIPPKTASKSSPPSIAKTDTNAEDPADKSAKPFWGNLKNIFKSEPGTPEKPNSTEEVVDHQATDGSVIPPKTASKSSIADNDSKAQDPADKSAKPFWGNLKNIFKSESGTPEKPNSTEEIVGNQETDGSVIPPKTASKSSIADNDSKAQDPADKSAKPFWGNLKNIFKSETSNPKKPNSNEEIVDHQGTDGTVIPPKTFKTISSPKQPRKVSDTHKESVATHKPTQRASAKSLRKSDVKSSDSQKNNTDGRSAISSNEGIYARKDKRVFKSKYTPQNSPDMANLEDAVGSRGQILAEMRNEVLEINDSKPSEGLLGRLFGPKTESEPDSEKVSEEQPEAPPSTKVASTNSETNAKPSVSLWQRLFGSQTKAEPVQKAGATHEQEPSEKSKIPPPTKVASTNSNSTGKPLGSLWQRLFGPKAKSEPAHEEKPTEKSEIPPPTKAANANSDSSPKNSKSLWQRLFGPKAKSEPTHEEKPAEKSEIPPATKTASTNPEANAKPTMNLLDRLFGPKKRSRSTYAKKSPQSSNDQSADKVTLPAPREEQTSKTEAPSKPEVTELEPTNPPHESPKISMASVATNSDPVESTSEKSGVPDLNPSAYWENFSNLFKKRNQGKGQPSEESISQDTNQSPSKTETVPEKAAIGATAQTEGNLNPGQTAPSSKPFWGNLKNFLRKNDKSSPNDSGSPDSIASQSEKTGGGSIDNTNNSVDIEKSDASSNENGIAGSKTKKRSFFGGLKNLFRKEKSSEPETHDPNTSAEVASSNETSDEEDAPAKPTDSSADQGSSLETAITENEMTEGDLNSASPESDNSTSPSPTASKTGQQETGESEFFSDLFSRKHQETSEENGTLAENDEQKDSNTEGPQSEPSKKSSWKSPFRHFGLNSSKNGYGPNDADQEAAANALFAKKAELGPDHLGVVSEVIGTEKGPFREPGKYQVSQKITGLLLPVGNGQLIQTKDHRIQMILKKPVLISTDQNTRFKIEKILEIHELVLEKGRIRIKVLKDAGLWTVRGRDMSMSLAPNSDVVVDSIGSMITRVTVLEGEVHCLPTHGQEPKLIESGKTLSLGLAGTDLQDSSSQKLEFLKSHLSISSMESYQKKLSSAQFFQNYPKEWPLERKLYSGALCTQCGYGFDTREQPFSHCPSCHEPLLSPEDNNSSPEKTPKSTRVNQHKKPSTLDYILGALPAKISLR